MAKKIEYLRDGRSPIPVNEHTSKLMRANKDRNTKPEVTLRKALWKNDIKGYRLHWKKAPGKPDIAFPSKKLAVFVNGCFWHRCPNCGPSMPKTNIEFWKTKFTNNKERDQRKINELKKINWEVITLWECQIKQNLESCINEVKSFLS